MKFLTSAYFGMVLTKIGYFYRVLIDYIYFMFQNLQKLHLYVPKNAEVNK